MSVLLPPQPAEVYVRRRAALGGAFAGPVILFAGDLVPRNYAANVYPFRAHSHFLYFTGLQWPGAVLLGQGGAWEIFAAPPAEPSEVMELMPALCASCSTLSRPTFWVSA